jgi:hypothetical protein
VGIDITALMRHARSENITIRPSGRGKLMLSNHRNHPFTSIIEANKSEILAWFEELAPRLAKGQKILIRTDALIWNAMGKSDTTARESHFMENLDTWDVLDSFLWPRRCPVGPRGCDPESPVLCRSCVR